jgi:hypothetical protein
MGNSVSWTNRRTAPSKVTTARSARSAGSRIRRELPFQLQCLAGR